MMTIFRLLIILLFLLFRTVIIFLGWIFIPIALLFKAYEVKKSPYNNRIGLAWSWWIMGVFQNWEDFLDNNDKGDYGIKKEWPLWRKIVAWNLIRNPANNLRYVPYLSCKINPSKVKFIGSLGNSDDMLTEAQLRLYDKPTRQWFLCWHGLYSCFFWQFYLFGKLRRIWVGWKIMPFDVFGLPDTSHRKVSAGFATQFKVL